MQCRVSLTEILMSGPDLTNQIVGVMTRFREESVVTMGDIEALFHQVQVSEKDRSLLRFLWWEDHNINNSITDFEIGIHVFGGTSLPSCFDYASKRTALDNEEKYMKEVSDTSRRNVYVDDLLISVRDVSTAICLLHEVIKLCLEGGFQLTKFVST